MPPCRYSIVTFLCCALLVVLPGSRAAADNFLPVTGWYLPVGAGFSSQSHDKDFLVGPEVSLVRWSEAFWAGGYVDNVRATSRPRGRVSVGPEIGWGILGLDGGLSFAAGGGPAARGGVVRGLVCFPSLQFFYREEFSKQESSYEWGVLFKMTTYGRPLWRESGRFSLPSSTG